MHSPRLKLFHYFGIEGVNASSAALFLCCISFWTKVRFGYSDTTNLLVTATNGFIYIFAAKYGGKLVDRIGSDRTLSICILGMAFTMLIGWIPNWPIMPFLTIMLYSFFIAPAWPAIEAAVLHCPGSTSMPNRLGFYNLTWSLGNGFALALGGILFTWNPNSILWMAGLLHLLQWCWLKLGSRNQKDEGDDAMEIAHRGDGVSRFTKLRFMYTAWLGNGLGFLMIAGFFALSPHVGQRLGLQPKFTIWLTSTLLFARAMAFFIFWKWERWHYHMGWSQWALWIAPMALAIAFFSTYKILVFLALIIFGMCLGLSYSGSLYYSLNYGQNKGEHGGMHESIIGIGVFFGPLLAAFISGLGTGTAGAQWTIITLTISINILGLWKIYHIDSTSRGDLPT